MPNLNRTLLMGSVVNAHLGALQNGTPVLHLVLSIAETWNTPHSCGRRTDCVECRVFGKRATALHPMIANDLPKPAYVEGKIRREMTQRPGAPDVTEDMYVEVSQFEFLTARTTHGDRA